MAKKEVVVMDGGLAITVISIAMFVGCFLLGFIPLLFRLSEVSAFVSCRCRFLTPLARACRVKSLSVTMALYALFEPAKLAKYVKCVRGSLSRTVSERNGPRRDRAYVRVLTGPQPETGGRALWRALRLNAFRVCLL